MGKRIAIIQGHPSPQPKHLCHALANAYADGALAAGHDVRRIEVGQLDFPLLRTAEEWKSGALPPALREAQESIGSADHMVILFPLWTGGMPALLKGFFEQVLRPGFGFRPRPGGGGLVPGLSGKSARVVVTMGMPALFFAWCYHAHGVRSLKRGVLGLCGIRPVRSTYIGSVDAKHFPGDKWIATLRELGRTDG